MLFHYDHAIQNYPYRSFFAEGLKAGRLRLWTGDLFCGFPLFAESQANALYPPFYLLFVALPAWVAYNFYHVLHFALAGVFTYFLARVLRISRGGALLAGLIYMMAGPVLFHAHHTNIVVGIAYLPLLLALIELTCQRRSLLLLPAFAAATGALALGAQPQYTLYCALASALYVAVRLRVIELSGGRRRQVAALAIGLGLAGAVGGILAAAQVLPLAELVQHSSRGGFELPGASSGVPGNLMTLLAPHYFGSPGLGSYWANMEPGLFSEVTMFMGVSTLLLAVVGAAADRTRRALVFLGLGIFAFIFSLGFHGSIYNAFGFLPVFRSSRFASRFAFVTTLCAAMLAGMGLDQLVRGDDRRRVKRAALLAIGLIVAAGAVCVCIAGAFNAGLMSLGREELARAMPRLGEFELSVLWHHLHRTLPADVWRLVATLILGAALLLLCGARLLTGRTALALWGLLIFAELALVGHEFTVVTDPDLYSRPPRLVEKLRELPPGRIFRYRQRDRLAQSMDLGVFPSTRGWALEPELYHRCLDRLPPNANMLWGIPSVAGFCPLQTRRLKTLLGRPRERSTLIEFDLSHVLDLLGARYIVTPRDELPPTYRPLGGAGEMNLFENPGALPRAFIVHNALAAPSERLTANTLRDGGFDYRGTIFVHDPPGPLIQDAPGRAGPLERANITEDTGDAIGVSAQLERPGYLVLSDQHYPGWHVEVDGAPAELLRVDYLLKGVRLPAGKHEVRFVFRPETFRAGVQISLLGLLSLSVGMLLSILGRRRLMGRDEGSGLLAEPYAPRSGRMVLLAALLFLALGPMLRPALWQEVGAQLDPHRYQAEVAVSRAAYASADGDTVGAFDIVLDAYERFPRSAGLRRRVVSEALRAARQLTGEGRFGEARRIARQAVDALPGPARRRAPALTALAGAEAMPEAETSP